MATRYDKTLADYLVIAISPALIMTLVGSLVFFLLEVFYQGNFAGRLHYILALFVFAAVLIGRIAIEDGKERAALFALPLAAATLLAITRFVAFQGALLGQASFVINCCLLGLIWWSADRLTWDCTMIDETESASGEGLLDAAGLGGRETAAAGSVGWDKRASASAGPPVAHGGPALAALACPTLRTRPHATKPHAPGVWVIYFSLAALPLFGLGQLAIPAVQEGRRRYAFCLLAVYVASGLGLLLTTSFLGLRRYLRQRRLPMPMIMAGTWILLGCVLIVAVMGLALLLPRPNAEFAVSQIPHVMGSPDQKPSEHAVGNDGVKGDKPGHPESDDKDKPAPGRDEAPRSSGQPSEKPKDENSSSEKPDRNKSDRNKSDSGSAPKSSADGAKARRQPDNRSGGSQGGDGKSKTGKPSEKTPDAGQNPSPAEPSPPNVTPPPIDLASAFAWLLPLLQVLLYLVVAGLAAFWAWRHRAGILAAVRDALAGFRSFWERLFGGRKKLAEAAEAERGPPRPRQFADFADPFAAGMAGRLSSDQLVRYLFEAVEAWARENGCPREPEQTPHEFARNIGLRNPTLGHLADCLADHYCEAAYAPGRLKITNLQPLQDLWRELKAPPIAANEPRHAESAARQ